MLPIATNWSMSNWVHVKLLRLYQDPTVVIILESTGSQGFHKPTANTINLIRDIGKTRLV